MGSPAEAVRTDKVIRALRQRAVILAQSMGFSDRATRLELTAMILGLEHLSSFTDLDDRQLRRLIFGLESAALVAEAWRQQSVRRNVKARR